MKNVTKPNRKDVIKSIVYIFIFVVVISVSAFLLLPIFWYVWLGIVVAGILIMVNWHKAKTAYRCPNCEHIYEISFFTDLSSPHGFTLGGAWLLLRCPSCGERRKTMVLKKVEEETLTLN